MEVSAATSAGQQGARRENKALVDYETFLTLLLAQLENQDPTEPLDPAQQLSQLAQFSQVGATLETNTKLDGLLSALSLSQADSVIGRTVTSADGSVSGTVASLSILSEGSVATLEDGREIVMGPGITIA